MKKSIILSETEIKKLIKTIVTEALRPSQFRNYVGAFNRERYSDLFKSLGDKYGHDKNYYRVYIPLESQKRKGPISGVEKQVTDFLKTNGYQVLDYIKGTVRFGDAKNTTTIGKVLTRLKADELMKKFVSDESRKSLTSDIGDLMIVISRHPYDIAGADTDRNWTNCMTMGHATSKRVEKLNSELNDLNLKLKNLKKAQTPEDFLSQGYQNPEMVKITRRIQEIGEELGDRKRTGENVRYLMSDVKEGSLISYLIRKDDKNINNPLAVLNIKPYIRDGETSTDDKNFILVSDNNMYGQGRPEFKDTIDKILNEFNGTESYGVFCLKDNIYVDSSSRKITINSPEENKFIDQAYNIILDKIKEDRSKEFEISFDIALDNEIDEITDNLELHLEDDGEVDYHLSQIEKLVLSKKEEIIDSVHKNNQLDISKGDVSAEYRYFLRDHPEDKYDLNEFIKYFFYRYVEYAEVDEITYEIKNIADEYMNDNGLFD